MGQPRDAESAGAQDADADGIIVFDFDGTLTTADTFALFLRYYRGVAGWLWRIAALLPTFAAYKLGLIDRHAVKAAVIRRFFAGERVADVDARADVFANEVIPPLIRPKGLETFKAFLTSDPDRLYICSASIAPYLKAWGRSLGMSPEKILSVELESKAGRLTGAIEGYNVWGPNKVRRIHDTFAPASVRILEAFGDTRGDRELLHAADVSHWKPFRL